MCVVGETGGAVKRERGNERVRSGEERRTEKTTKSAAAILLSRPLRSPLRSVMQSDDGLSFSMSVAILPEPAALDSIEVRSPPISSSPALACSCPHPITSFITLAGTTHWDAVAGEVRAATQDADAVLHATSVCTARRRGRPHRLLRPPETIQCVPSVVSRSSPATYSAHTQPAMDHTSPLTLAFFNI